MRVALSGSWPDHIFNDDYKLLPIGELSNFININKHLPGIPSANEINTNGINVAEMNAALLEKIEQLHLYIIQQQNKIDQQDKNFQSLQKQIDELKRALNK